MCLVKVRQEEEVIVPYRPARRRSPSPVRQRRSTHRVSREIIRESRPASSTYLARPPSASYIAVPAPAPLAIPAPQPVPVFVQPSHLAHPPPASHISSHHGAHYVEVSPRSSVTSDSPSRSDYVLHEREYRRERNYSPESSPRYETFRYVEGSNEPRGYDRYERRERSRSRVRERSMSRGRDYGYDEPRGGYRETTRIVVNDGRRRSEYAR